jgi:cytochrome c oxidase subunit II
VKSLLVAVVPSAAPRSAREGGEDMRSSRVTVSGLVGLLLMPLLLWALPPEVRQITVKAKKYEFQPNRIELKVGEPVEITFESLDTKHGFSCKDLKLEKVLFTKDSPGKVTFTPDKPGTYKFKCAHFCGLGHPKMKGEIVVTP